jgi:hypothetical protein
MPLAVRSEVDTWGDGDLGAFEDVEGHGPESHMTVCPAGRLDIYEGTLEYWSLVCTPDEPNRRERAACSQNHPCAMHGIFDSRIRHYYNAAYI